MVGLLGAWLAQSTGAARDLDLHKVGNVRAAAQDGDTAGRAGRAAGPLSHARRAWAVKSWGGSVLLEQAGPPAAADPVLQKLMHPRGHAVTGMHSRLCVVRRGVTVPRLENTRVSPHGISLTRGLL